MRKGILLAGGSATHIYPLTYSVRKHWGIENYVHWVLDIAFLEPDEYIRILCIF